MAVAVSGLKGLVAWSGRSAKHLLGRIPENKHYFVRE